MKDMEKKTKFIFAFARNVYFHSIANKNENLKIIYAKLP